jgi:hypothetical protein
MSIGCTYKVDKEVQAQHVVVVLRVSTDVDCEFGYRISSGPTVPPIPFESSSSNVMNDWAVFAQPVVDSAMRERKRTYHEESLWGARRSA